MKNEFEVFQKVTIKRDLFKDLHDYEMLEKQVVEYIKNLIQFHTSTTLKEIERNIECIINASNDMIDVDIKLISLIKSNLDKIIETAINNINNDEENENDMIELKIIYQVTNNNVVSLNNIDTIFYVSNLKLIEENKNIVIVNDEEETIDTKANVYLNNVADLTNKYYILANEIESIIEKV